MPNLFEVLENSRGREATVLLLLQTALPAGIRRRVAILGLLERLLAVRLLLRVARVMLDVRELLSLRLRRLILPARLMFDVRN